MYIPLTFEGSQAKCLFASGGYEGFFISGSQQYKYHWFTGSANLEVQKGTIDNVQIYVVGGGGGGGIRNASIGGGGGGGGGVNYTMNGRLFQGTYSIKVGKGGFAGSETNTNGNNGVTSSFIGSNISMIAQGGGGGRGQDSSVGGTGGFPNGGDGGGGTSAQGGNGDIGVYINVASQSANGFGCGGGGACSVFAGNNQGFSCNDVQYGAGASGGGFAGDGANFYGMGGGGGNQNNSAGDGGSGSVIIQYPIYDYCSNYFNETGSCGCEQITFDVTDGLNYNPVETGSYIYMPCGGDRFVSGSLFAYGPLTVCAVSNSYYAYSSINEGPDPDVVNINAGFVATGIECISASLTPVACSPEAFVATCTSSIVTIYTPSASVGNPTDFGYVAKNETTHSMYTTTTDRVKYLCISSGSKFNGIARYPQILTGNFANLYNTASCNTIRINSPGTGRGRIYLCDGSNQTLINPAPNTTYCIDMIFGVRPVSGFSVFNYSILGSCLSGSFDTSSCGCP